MQTLILNNVMFLHVHVIVTRRKYAIVISALQISCLLCYQADSGVRWSPDFWENLLLSAVMEEIIEHPAEEGMEARKRSEASSFLESLSEHRSIQSNAHGSTQSSQRLLAYSDALISIIATVMVGNK